MWTFIHCLGFSESVFFYRNGEKRAPNSMNDKPDLGESLTLNDTCSFYYVFIIIICVEL